METATAIRARPTSGTQYALRSGRYEATVASVGASLRSLSYDGRDLVVPFDADEVRPWYRGALLAPWPNRVVDGVYTFEGVTHQLPLTEPQRSNALHRLLLWTDFAVADLSPDRVNLRADVEPQAGYPWRVEVSTTYSLDSDGLMQTVTAHNVGSGRAPWGTGGHPYVTMGSGVVDEWVLEVPASEVLAVTEDRLAPAALTSVSDDPERFDFRVPRTIGTVRIDHAFTRLSRGEDGAARVRVSSPSGGGVEVSFDRSCPWVQIHTADADERRGLVVEPMTCAPDAYNSGAGLVVLEPGEQHVANWRITAVGQ